MIYEHFGGKEGLYAVVVDREVRALHDAIRAAITTPDANPRALIELGTMALLDYIDDRPNGFRIISRDSSGTSPEGSFQTILSDIASRVEDLLADEFGKRGLEADVAPLYAQMLVGLVALAGQWWMDNRRAGHDQARSGGTPGQSRLERHAEPEPPPPVVRRPDDPHRQRLAACKRSQPSRRRC